MSKPKPKQQELKPTVLLLQTSDGDVRLTVPPGYRVTWGPSIPSATRQPGTRLEYALRVYRGQELLAAFTQVYQFWDITLELVREEKALNQIAVGYRQFTVPTGAGLRGLFDDPSPTSSIYGLARSKQS